MSDVTVDQPDSVPAWRGLEDIPRATKAQFGLVVTSAADGAAVTIPVNVVRGADPGPVLVAVGGVHGDEYEGPTGLIDVWDELVPATTAGTLIAVPILNPIAFRSGSRRGTEDAVDLNRVFPGVGGRSVSYQIARTFMDRVIPEADFVVSMHGWSDGYVTRPFVEFPCAGPTSEAARLGAAAFGIPLLNPLDPGAGRLLTEATARGLPMIEVEIGGQNSTIRANRELYESGLRALMRHLGLIASSGDGASNEVSYVDRTDVVACRGGLMRPEVDIGDDVIPGQVLASVRDLNLRRVDEITSPVSGSVGVLRLCASLHAGDLVSTIFSARAWPVRGK